MKMAVFQTKFLYVLACVIHMKLYHSFKFDFIMFQRDIIVLLHVFIQFNYQNTNL